MGAGSLRCVSHGDSLASQCIVLSHGSGVDTKYTVGIVDGQGDITSQVVARQIEGSGSGFASIGLHSKLLGCYCDDRVGRDSNRLYTDEHQGIEVIDGHTVVEGVSVIGIPGVQLSRHAKVHVVHVILGIITIQVESVASNASRIGLHVKSAIDEGTTGTEFRLNQCSPLLIGIVNGTVIIVPSHHIVCTGIEIKSLDGILNLIILGTTAVGGIVHGLGIAHVEHQVADGINLCLRETVDAARSGGIGVQQIVPVKGVLGQSRHDIAMGLGDVARHGRRRLGIPPVVHHLCQRYSSASYLAVGIRARALSRGLHVVRLALCPSAGQQWLNRDAATVDAFVHHQARMCLEVLHLFLELVEDELHGFGEVVQVGEGAFAIGEDFAGAVVTGDDDVTLVGVHDVVSCQGGIARVLHFMYPLDGWCRGHQAVLGSFVKQEVGGFGLGGGHVNVSSNSRRCREQ